MKIFVDRSLVKPFTRFVQKPQLFALATLIPGVLVLMMGVLALVAPKLLLILAAVFFLYLGTVLVAIGWKLVQIRRKLSALATSLEAQVELRQMSQPPANDEAPEYNKEILH